MRALLLLPLTILFLSLTGCAFHSSPDPLRGSQGVVLPDLPSDSWPARSTSLLTDLDSLTPDKLTLLMPVRISHPGDRSTKDFRMHATVLHHGVYGRGLLREFSDVKPEAKDAVLSDNLVIPIELLNGLQFVSFPANAYPSRQDLDRIKVDQPERYQRFVMRRLGLRQEPHDSWALSSRGTRMRLYEPTGEHAGGLSRGLVVSLSSLAGLEYELPTVRELTSRGWAVLVINASTVRRFEEPVFLDAGSDPTPAAKRLARIIDNRVAEIAYAAEAGVEFVTRQHPNLRAVPIVVVGFSAGALTAPAVAEILRDRVAAIVLVGGGANLLDISQRSSLTNGGIEVIWRDKKSPPEAVKKLNDAYVLQSKLDPYALCPRLTGIPALLLHGLIDDIVPTDAGDLLYERLGKPERLSYPLGHRGLFWLLPTQSGRIADWIDEAVVPIEVPSASIMPIPVAELAR
ncbi:MAG: hypothetical protein H7210_06970 [Pyrinomonadaceae bacterium]|nr:hypothetical protein [Phycisphaerales bacterium]